MCFCVSYPLRGHKVKDNASVCVCVFICSFLIQKVPTSLLEHDHSLWCCMNRQGAGPLHRAVGSTRHAVAAPRIGEP